MSEENEDLEKPVSIRNSKLKSIIKLLRIKQWYKGLVLFLGMIFAGKLLEIFYFDFSTIFIVSLGFITFGLISSVNYIINDILDKEKDKVHPEKAERPLPSGEISVRLAILIMIFIIFIILLCSWLIIDLLSYDQEAFWYCIIVLTLFLNGVLYNTVFKHFVFVDIIMLSLNYIFRTMVGCFIAKVEFTPWLYILVYEVALFLAINKRIADLEYLGPNATDHKPVYSEYDMEILKNLAQMMTICLFLTYAFYCVIGPAIKVSTILNNNRGFILFSIPVGLYLILRYNYLVKRNPEIARNPEKVVKDFPLVIASIIIVIMILIANYFDIYLG